MSKLYNCYSEARLESLAGQFCPRALCFTPLVYSMAYEGRSDTARLKFFISSLAQHPQEDPFSTCAGLNYICTLLNYVQNKFLLLVLENQCIYLSAIRQSQLFPVITDQFYYAVAVFTSHEQNII